MARKAANLEAWLDPARPFAIQGLYGHVAYLRQGERVVALQDERIALTPVSLQVSGRFAFQERIAADAAGRLQDGRLLLGGFVFELTAAESVDLALQPCQNPASMAGRIPDWRSVVFTALVDALAEQSIRRKPNDEPSIGIGDLLMGLRQLRPLPQPARPRTGVDVRGAFVRQLNQFLVPAGAGHPDPQALAAVIGLGPGLTPSGDDFLIGVLSVLRFFCPAGPEEPSTHGSQSGSEHRPTAALEAFLHPLDQAILERLPQTGLVSAAFLREAAAGRFSERLCSHCAAFGLGQDGSSVARQMLAEVARSGHCSGTDTLGGMLLGLNLVEASLAVASPAAPVPAFPKPASPGMALNRLDPT